MAEKILVTGASGFIGSHLVRFFESAGYEVHCLMRGSKPGRFRLEHFCELTDKKGLERVFAEVRPDYFFHLASRAFPNRELEDLEPQIQNTILPTITLARLIPQSVKLALFFGSCEEYGNGPTPFMEDQALRNISPYGWAKISAFHATSMIASQRQFAFSWLRPFLTFGPNQKTNQLIPSLIVSCLKGDIVQLSPGEQTRDFIFIEDLCAMLKSIVENPEKARHQVLNLCSAQPRSVRFMAELVQSLCGSGTLNFGGLAYRHNEAMSFYGCNEKFRKLYGDPEFTPLENALQQTVESYRTQLN